MLMRVRISAGHDHFMLSAGQADREHHEMDGIFPEAGL